jgi:glycosyltransferase involved in cell wall biosynthesis
MTILPILIAARNEERNIFSTLASLLTSAEILHRQNDVRVHIIVCDNNNTDDTQSQIRSFINEHAARLSHIGANVEIIEEKIPGKPNAIKKLIDHTEVSLGLCYDRVVFSDAEVGWSPNSLTALWDYKANNPATVLVGTNITPRNTGKSIWAMLEHIPYLGYGKAESPRGQGLYMKFVSGMGYMADRQALSHFTTIPAEIGNEDVALSALVGPENIAIVPDAVVAYNLSESWDEFVKIRGRHVRELIRLERWLENFFFAQLRTEREDANSKILRQLARAKALDAVYSVSESRTLQITKGFLTSEHRFGLSLIGIRHWLRGMPLFKMPLDYIAITIILMPLAYAYLKIRGKKQLASASDKAGWVPVRSRGSPQATIGH